VRALIEGSDGAIDHVRTSETRRLAYPIKKQNEGVYVVVNARFQKEMNLELDRFMKLEESVLRHMILRVED
jgi:small subunit ribosomal protein S6